MFYKLVNKKPVPVRNIEDMDQVFGCKEWRVASNDYHGYWVSTVFLPVDHGFGRSQKPILFETMIFHGSTSIAYKRCSSWDDAIQQHKDMMYQLATDLDIDFPSMIMEMKNKLVNNISTEQTYSSPEEFILDLTSNFST